MTYNVYITDKFEKTFEKRHKEMKPWLYSVIERLEQNPKIGKPLGGRLHNVWQLRSGSFRVWYEIDDSTQKVTLKVILHKDEAKKMY